MMEEGGISVTILDPLFLGCSLLVWICQFCHCLFIPRD
jgi:hypothetical protein